MSIFGVSIFQFSEQFSSERFLHFASVAERVRFAPRPDVLASGFLRSFDQGELYRWFCVQWPSILARYLRPHTGDAHGGAPPPPSEEPYTARERARQFCHDFVLSERKCDFFLRSIDAARRDGQAVVVVQIPCRDDFNHELAATYAAEYRAYTNWLKSIPDVPVVLFEDPSACGLVRADDFRDCDHLSPTGSVRFTRHLADWIRREHPEIAAHLEAIPSDERSRGR